MITTALSALLLVLLVAAAPAVAAPFEAERVTTPARVVDRHWTNSRLRAAEPVDAPIASRLAATSAGASGGGSADPSYVPAAAAGERPHAALRDGMAASRPADDILSGSTRDEILDPAEPEFSSHGKVFFTIPDGDEAGDYVCSGTAVNSKNRSVVWTAGHCVFPAAGAGFATNWTFIPGYTEAAQPYGQWPAKRLATTGPWQEASNIKYDFGAAVVRRNPAGAGLQDVVGARGIGFDQPREQIYRAYGYPAVPTLLAPEFTGEREFRCTSRVLGTDVKLLASGPNPQFIECDMTGGSSGGGWIVDTTLLSVTSYGYDLELTNLYGPYMSTTAKALYRSVRAKPKKPRPSEAKGGGKGSKGGKR